MTVMMFVAVLASVMLLSGLFVGSSTAYAAISTDKGTYTWTDKVRIKVMTHGWSEEESFVEISTPGHELKSYHLSKARDKLYIGEIVLTGFLHDVDGDGKPDTSPRTSGNGSNDGFLETTRDGKITISLRFADGTKMSTSARIAWNHGKITLDKAAYDIDGSANLQVIDPDMNLNPRTLDKVKVNVLSDSDKAGIRVEAIETQEESGIFETAVSFVQDKASSGDRLFAIPGDAIHAKYEDHTMPKPHQISDSLEIVSSATVDSSIPFTERLETSPILLSDVHGKQLVSFSSDKQIQIVGTITNNQNFAQKFVYFVQVKNNSTNFTESVSWMQGEILSKQSMDVSQSWIPKKTGTYQIETFVWESIDDPAVMSTPMSSLITVK
ncbi:MAG: hypothetical protein ACR2LL_11145 [Nitrosopumilus sp.]